MTNLKDYNLIILNTSAGKDSQAMIDHVVGLAKGLGITDRLVAVHADLGEMEWDGTGDLAKIQADAYGIPLVVVTREQGGFVKLVQDRRISLDKKGKYDAPAFPDSKNRLCTSSLKRDVIAKIIRAAHKRLGLDDKKDKIKVLNCMGIRAEESSARAKKTPFKKDDRLTTKNRIVDIYYPIFDWTEVQVWATIKASGVPYHRAYDLGMPRLSCVFCVFAPKSALIIAGKENPVLLQKLIDLEVEVRSTWRHKFSLQEIKDAIAAGEGGEKVESWNM